MNPLPTPEESTDRTNEIEKLDNAKLKEEIRDRLRKIKETDQRDLYFYTHSFSLCFTLVFLLHCMSVSVHSPFVFFIYYLFICTSFM